MSDEPSKARATVTFLAALAMSLCMLCGFYACSARAQATNADFATPPLQVNGSTIAEQWDNLILGHQGLAAFFKGKIATGTEPDDSLHGIYFGNEGQSTNRKDWRVRFTSANALAIDENTATDASPVWVNRLTVDSSGITSAPAAHTHAAADTVSGTFASARISQASVEQWAVQTPTALRIPLGNISAQLEPGWIPQNGVTQYQSALQLNATQIIAGQLDDNRLKLTNVTQFGYILQAGDAFIKTSGNCPTGTTEATGARAAKLAGADTAGGDINYPDAAGIVCKSTAVGVGCLAPDPLNYTDFVGIPEMPSHTHTGPSHSHTTTIANHSHLGPSHTHTMAHTHSVTLGSHAHSIVRELANSDAISSGANSDHLVGDGNESGTLVTLGQIGNAIQSTDLGSVTSGASSAASTGAGGTGATGLDGGGTFGSGLGGTGNTGATGGTDPSIGPIFSVKICVVN